MSGRPDPRTALRLVVVTPGDAHLRFDATIALAARAFAGGATAMWIRERALDDARLHDLAASVRRAADACRAAVWISGRADVAAATGLDAVQLGFVDARPEALAAERRAGLRVGYSAHDPLDASAIASADHVVLAPLFATDPALAKAPPLGTARFRELRRSIAVPVVALGGIDATNAQDAIAAGADGVAVLRAVCRTADPEAATARLRRAIDAALVGRALG